MISLDKIKKYTVAFVWALMLLFLFMPLLQDLTGFKKFIKPLNGSFQLAPDTELSWKGWFNRSYQDEKENFVRDNFGLRNYYIRINSQIKFNLFKKAQANYVVVGNENYLFETGYFDAYFGRDFLGEENIDKVLSRMKQVQDTMQKAGKLFLLVLAPGKASFYPEYIPGSYISEPTVSNYLYTSVSATKAGINLIDFNKYFIEQKHKSRYPLYPQYGIHWSNYGSLRAFDSMNRFIGWKLGCRLPELKFTKINVSDQLQHTDNDIITGMNLLVEPLPAFKMAYPEWKVIYDTVRHRRPKVLVMADSFWWYLYSTGLPERMYSKNSFWFYNATIYPESFNNEIRSANIDYYRRIRDADVIIVLYSAGTLVKFANGFDEMCHEVYFGRDPEKEKIQQIRNGIASSPAWMEQVRGKAAQKNISVDSMVTIDALYIYNQNKN